jgi:dinuclear metal center YbgI/SA1388 family protein
MTSDTHDAGAGNPGGVELQALLEYLDELLSPDEFADYGPNGLQVPGPDHVKLVVTGVSGQLELFERARELGAELVIVHHGILWDFQPRRLSSQQATRLRALLCAQIGLAAYHLPLDAHLTVGNNALLAEALGATELTPFGMHRGRPIGVAARFGDAGLPAAELFDRVRAVTEREPLVVGEGPALVRSIGIVSGAGADSLPEAIALGLDAFLTGEPREHVTADAREAGVHFIAAGHYATETFGVRRLGELLAERFAIKHRFIDIANPV